MTMNPKILDNTAMHPHSRLSEQPVRADLETIKTRQQAMWGSGDFGQIGVRLQLVGETLCEAIDLLAFERVLDVAAGNGNASLAAARRFAHVTSTDYVPALLEQARLRAEADRLPSFQVADAEISLRRRDSTWFSRPTASCSRRTRSAWQPSSCVSSGPVAGSGSRTGRPRALSGSSSRWWAR
jgi:SAM-dependent methyltransferase